MKSVLQSWGIFIGCCLAWEAATRAAANRYFPAPSTIVATAHELWFSGPPGQLFLTESALDNILPSLGRMSVGLLISVVVGVVLGFALGRSPTARAYLDPLLQLFRAIPPPTMVPVFIVLLQIGTQMQLATIVFATIWPIMMNTTDGFRSIEPLYLETSQVFRLSAAQRLRLVLIPSAMPKIFAGLRLSLSVALILMVFSELMPGTSNGIGFLLQDAYAVGDLPRMWSAIVLIGLLGYLLNMVLLAVQRRALAWQAGAQRLSAE